MSKELQQRLAAAEFLLKAAFGQSCATCNVSKISHRSGQTIVDCLFNWTPNITEEASTGRRPGCPYAAFEKSEKNVAIEDEIKLLVRGRK